VIVAGQRDECGAVDVFGDVAAGADADEAVPFPV